MGIKFLFYILFLILLSNSVSSKADAKPSGLTLKLHHRESIESNNLTRIEKFEKMIHRSKLRANLISTASAGQPTFHHPALTYDNSWNYLVEAYVGTPAQSVQYMILDTNAELSWIQCNGCVKEGCFAQRLPMFDPRGSSTYQLLPCDHQLCKPYECNHNHCKFKEWDSDDVHVEGFMSIDDFIFKSEAGDNVTIVNGVVFGCAYGTIGFRFTTLPNNNISGVFGLGSGRRSFASQFAPQQRFGYCLADWQFGPPAYPSQLLFGDDAELTISGYDQTTPVEMSERSYFLTFLGMQIGSKNFTFAPDRFKRYIDPNGTSHGGFVIDSGMPISVFAPDVYEILSREIADYMKTIGLKEIDPFYGLDLCWDFPNGDESKLPSVTLLFQIQDEQYADQHAKLEIVPRSLFFIESAKDQEHPDICLGVMPLTGGDPRLNFLGVKQQTGNRFVFDGQSKTLSWRKSDCSVPPPKEN